MPVLTVPLRSASTVSFVVSFRPPKYPAAGDIIEGWTAVNFALIVLGLSPRRQLTAVELHGERAGAVYRDRNTPTACSRSHTVISKVAGGSIGSHASSRAKDLPLPHLLIDFTPLHVKAVAEGLCSVTEFGRLRILRG